MSTSITPLGLPARQAEYKPRPGLVIGALKINVTYYVAAAAGLAAHLLLALPVYGLQDRVLAWAPLVILLTLIRKHVNQPYSGVPVLVVVAFQVYLFYSVAQFSQESIDLYTGYYSPPGEPLSLALILVVAGELVFIWGYHVASALAAKSRPALYTVGQRPTARWAGVLLLYSSVGFSVYALSALRPDFIPLSIRFTVIQIFNVYLGLVALLYVGFSCKKKYLLIAAYALAAAISFVALVQGVLGGMASPIFVVVVGRWIWGGRSSMKLVLAVVVAVIILNPVKSQFRNLAWEDKDVSTLEKVEDRLVKWSVAFEDVWFEGEGGDAVLATASRASDLVSFAQTVDYVPRVTPHTQGEGLGVALTYWIPRVIYPDKGSATDLIYNRYALTFGYATAEGLETTSVGLSIFSEGYWGFGWLGVLGYLFAAGAIYGYLFGNNGKTEQVSTLICLVYMAPSIFILQAISVTIPSMVSFLIGVCLALWLLSVVTHRKTPPAENKKADRQAF